MRLTCPTCSAVYELPDDQLPAGGSHVQCSACHTRWFARARPPSAERPSEDEIIARLETRGAGRRAEPDEEEAAKPPVAGPAVVPIAFPGPARPAPQPPRPATAPDPTPAAPAAAATPVMRETTEAAEATRVPAPAQARAAETPTTPLRPRPERPAPPPALVPVEPARRRGGLAGFLLALALGAAAGGVYVRADAVAATAPALAGAVGAYANRVDATRDWIEARVGPTRDRLTGP